MRIIGGGGGWLEMVRHNNNRGVGIIGGGVLGKIENSCFLPSRRIFYTLCEQ